jgi:predicted aspartyl protease
LVLACATAAAGFPTSDSLSVEEILARHAEAMGGFERLTTFRTYYARGRVEVTGFPAAGTRVSWFARPCRTREEIDLGMLRVTAGVDDGVGWLRDANGRVTLRKDAWSVKEALLGCFLQRFDYLRPGATEMVAEGPRSVGLLDDRECVVLRLVEEKTELFLDPETWLLLGTRGTEEGLESIAIFDDYREVQGIQVAFSEETRIPQVGQVVRTTLQEVAFDQFLPDSLFAIPHGQIRDFEFTDGKPAATVPISLVDGLLYLDVSVGGKPPVVFLLDSGAGKTVLDSTYAAELGLAMEAALPGIGAGDVSQVYLVTIPSLTLEGVRLDEQSGAAVALSDWAGWLEGSEIRGVLGFDFLSRFVTRIDYARGQVTFVDPDSFRTYAGERPAGASVVGGGDHGGPVVVDAPLVMNVFTLPVRVNGSEPTTFILDTGAQVTVLGREFADRHGLLEQEGITTEAYGIGGAESLRLVNLTALEVGGFRLSEPMVAVRLREGGALQVLLDLVGGSTAGILGGNILQSFILTLDYGNQQVTFERGERFEGGLQ